MVRGFFLMTCAVLVLAVQHSVQATDPTTQAGQSWKKEVLDQLRDIKNALSAGLSQSGGGLGAVVAQMQNQIVATTSTASSMKADLKKTLLDHKKTKLDLHQTQLELQKTQEELKAAKELGLKSDQGSTFVRWGRKTCPANTTLVYSGVAGGKLKDQKGSGTNRLCLTRNPQFDNTPMTPHFGELYGAEYEELPGHHDQDVPCSVCRARQSTTIMMAATLTCPSGWTPQYTGHLTSNWIDYFATEYVCLDGSPENDYSGGNKNDNGLLFFYVSAVCGSLPCPPYKNNKVVTCVVCSR